MLHKNQPVKKSSNNLKSKLSLKKRSSVELFHLVPASVRFFALLLKKGQLMSQSSSVLVHSVL
jgi:hypothetical protein